ncbi:hypothetical protein KY325_01945 [Candidatus Woesearchaeota archaeon]|nr:hypothetical protein [Candidatus Woesearchaeota archaeon]
MDIKSSSILAASVIIILLFSICVSAKINCIDIPKGINQYPWQEYTPREMQNYFPQSLGKADFYIYTNGFVMGQVLFDSQTKAKEDLDKYAQIFGYKRTLESVCDAGPGFWNSDILKAESGGRVGSLYFVQNKCIVFIEAPEIINKESSTVRLAQMICQRRSSKELICNDGKDNDADGRTDCGDSDCTEFCETISKREGAAATPSTTTTASKNCKNKGEVTMQGDIPCCPGLTAVKFCDFKGVCYDDFSYCLPCGNNVCDELENKDNCAIDCAPETLPATGVEDITIEPDLPEAGPLPEVETEEKIGMITSKPPLAARYKLTPAHATILVIGVIILILFILIVLYLFKKKH